MNPIASVGTSLLAALRAPNQAGHSVPAGPPVETGSRDEQIAELGSTASSVNALQSLAMQPPAPLSLPPTQHTAPPQANTGDELVASMSGGDQ